MYELLDESNDYAIDARPPGLEVTEENVVVLQDLNQVTDLEEMVQVAENALMDLSIFMRHQTQVTEAIQNKDPKRGKAILLDAVCFRNAIERRYQLTGAFTMATETFHYGYDVLVALEAEADKQKNIFQKMIDAIVKAFKWLWDNIKKVFGKVIPDDGEKRKKQKEKVEAAEKSGAKPDPAVIESTKLSSYFPELNGEITPDIVIKKVETAIANLKTIYVLGDIFFYLTGGMKEVADALAREGDKLDYKTFMNGFYDKTDERLKNIPTLTADSFKNHGLEIPNTVDKDTIRGIEGFLRDGKLVFWIENIENVRYYRSKFVTLKASETERKFKVATSSDIDKLNKLMEEFKAKEEDATKKFVSLAADSERVTSNDLPRGVEAGAKLLSDLNQSTADKENAKYGYKIIQQYMNYAKEYGSLIHNSLSAIQATGAVRNMVNGYIEQSSNVWNVVNEMTEGVDANGNKKEEKKEEKAE